ncbi:hypothetical protein ACHAW5_000063 [Stephanodiscus triporus]|uniref:Uncharacterized protein n=1 Tax=Stephanodiscus triporus TaxID=2934178 RepID=A0ABD3PBF0_9STRA
MTELNFYLAIMSLVYLLAPPAESSLHISTRLVTPTRLASTWKQSSSTFGPSTPLAASPTAFVPSPRPDKSAIVGSIDSFRRLAFLSHFVHHSYTDSPSSQSVVHLRTPTCAPRRHRFSASLSSKNRDDGSDNSNEEYNIQRLYQQVQEEDSEWFYQTFSKLLAEDPSEKSDSSREEVVTEEAKRNDYDASRERVTKGDDGARSTENMPNTETEVISVKDATNSFSRETFEPPQSSIGSERNNIPIMQQSRREIVEEDVRALNGAVQHARTFDEGTRKDDNKGREDYEGSFDDDDEYEDSDAYDENDSDEDRPVSQSQRRQPAVSVSQERHRVKKPQTKSSVNARPPPIVRLRNTFDGDIEIIGPLADLLSLGYTKKEILVLRPQVLELIFEDRISKPKKGLPKRWVRLSKLNGFEKEAKEDEDDEDFEWEVEVVFGRSLDEKLGLEGHDTKDSMRVRNDSMDDEKSSSVSKVKEQETVGKMESAGAVSIPRESRSTPQQPKEDRIIESWGPFTSSHVPDTDDETAQKTTTESGTRQQRQQPIKEGEDEIVNNRRYDDEGGYDYSKRRPKPQRRLDDNGDEEFSPSKSPNKATPQRSLNNQQRRQRQRPPVRRRELLIDRGDNDEPPPNKFWMDLPTFRDFLRKEARFRLQILGPDWKESVLDESRWRYDLYKTWLTMLDDGIGENPLYEYGDRPRRPAERRRSSAQPRSRGERRRTRGQSERKLEEKDYDDDGGRINRRKARSETRGELERGESRRVEPRASIDRLPPPPRRPGTWKNFSDLDESLQRSSQERLKPDMSFPNFRDDKVAVGKDYDESYNEEDDDAPRSRRRPAVRPQRENAKFGNDVSYDRFFKDEREDSPRRRRRVRSAPERSQGQYSRKVETSSEQEYDEPS